MNRRARGLAAVAIGTLAGAWPVGFFPWERPAAWARVVAQAEAGGAVSTGAPGSSFVLAAYVITGGLLAGYGLSLWWRVRAAREELAFWRLEAAAGAEGKGAMDEVDGAGVAGGDEAARR